MFKIVYVVKLGILTQVLTKKTVFVWFVQIVINNYIRIYGFTVQGFQKILKMFTLLNYCRKKRYLN